MDNIQNILELSFKRVSIKDILEGRVGYMHFPKKIFLNMARHFIDHYSENDIDNLFGFLNSSLSKGKDTAFSNEEFSVLDTLSFFNCKVLKIMKNEPVCRYKHLLRWRGVSFLMEETLFVSSFLAYADIQEKTAEWENFAWKSVIGNDNVILHNLLQKGVAENHFHLKGSAPYFGLTWVNLMNLVDYPKFMKILKEYEEDRQQSMPNPYYSGGEDPLSILYLKAVLIRAYLFAGLKGECLKLKDEYIIDVREELKSLDLEDLDIKQIYQVKEIKKAIKQYRKEKHLKNISFSEAIRAASTDKGISKRAEDFIKYFSENLFCTEDMWEEYDENAVLSERQILKKILLEIRFLYGGAGMIESLICEDKQAAFFEKQNRKVIFDLLTDKEDVRMVISSLKIYLNNFRNSREIDKYDYMNSLKKLSLEENMYSAERWFMYTMFRRMYESEKERECGNLFYAYLVIKQRIRDELVQVNNKVGFYNFLRYQNRKEQFIDGTPLENVYIKYAIKESFQGQNIMKLEARIAPRDTAKQNRKYIAEKCDKQLKDMPEVINKVFYVFHFIKSNEKNDGIEMNVCRRYKIRNKIYKQALAIAKFQKKYPQEASRVLGIDASSEEIGCRPELFGQAFRFLKKMRPPQSVQMQGLRATYHVGEDFCDIVDGMRAIDEAIRFLNLSYGDRLGHALALGILPKEWYEFKRNKVLITRQDHLDDLVWIYQKIRKYNIRHTENILLSLEREFIHCFHEIYGGTSEENMRDYDINVYYDAWKLRGDAPELYREGQYKEDTEKLQEWDFYAENNHDDEMRKIRLERRCNDIYWQYLYNEDVKRIGGQTVEKKMPEERIAVISEIQKCMQFEVASRGLGIETNPSSNYLISTFKRYDKHPIDSWFNKGLVYNEEMLKKCPQIAVTINTDDQAVFGTSLENEYALMAMAWERKIDQNGKPLYQKEMIYEWLNNIRDNGIMWSFYQNNK